MARRTVGLEVVAAIRDFNRFYTPLVGALAKDYLHTSFNLQEARVVYEIANGPGRTARAIERATDFDQGYLSRIVNRLQATGIVRVARSVKDGRERPLVLTAKGKRAFRSLDQRANEHAAALVGPLDGGQRRQLARALGEVRALLSPESSPRAVSIRRMRVGDLGWSFYRQAVAYRDEFGYGPVFEKYLSQGLAPFLEAFDGERDCLWVAERDGRRVGFVAIQHAPERPGWAKLRWFLVEREARGQGVGRRLIEEAIQFSRQAGYSGIFLWTVNDLVDARRVYERNGFVLAKEKDDCEWAAWGKEQRWDLDFGRVAETHRFRRKRPRTRRRSRPRS